MTRTVVITGASAGIGAALATALAAEGHRLVLAARRERELAEVCESLHTDTLYVSTDVRRRADVERLRDAALERFGAVDVWVNNAGRGINASVLELTDEGVDEMMAVNVKSALYGMQAIVPHFQARGRGHLINVGSVLGRVPLAGYRSAYNAAKAALASLTANLRLDLRATHPDIHVSLVLPGMVTTDFGRHAIGGSPPVSWVAALRPDGPVPTTVQTAAEVAAAIAGLIRSPRAELYTDPASGGMVRRYFEDVATFEAELGR